jgi:hypothetical protein
MEVSLEYLDFCFKFGFVGEARGMRRGMREGELLEKFPLDPFKTFWGKYRGFVIGKRL